MHGNPVDVGKLQKVVLRDSFRKKGVEGLTVFYSPIVGLILAFAIYSVVENQAISKTKSKNKQADAHANY